MTVLALANTGFGIVLICAVIVFCYIGKRYRDLKNYTFQIEQSLLKDRPEMCIPLWRKHQRNRDIYRRAFKDEDHVRPVGPAVASGSKTFTLD
ncbi:MAG: hypothetical protein ACYSWO_21455 [Planctomycetota bacterium]|jgi:hypothetical protein